MALNACNSSILVMLFRVDMLDEFVTLFRADSTKASVNSANGSTKDSANSICNSPILVMLFRVDMLDEFVM